MRTVRSKIKLEGKNSDDNKLRFILVSQRSQCRIVQFWGQAGTLAYIHEPKYAGKDSFEFSKNSQVSMLSSNQTMNNPVRLQPIRKCPLMIKVITDSSKRLQRPVAFFALRCGAAEKCCKWWAKAV